MIIPLVCPNVYHLKTSLLGCDALSCAEYFSSFRKIILSLTLGTSGTLNCLDLEMKVKRVFEMSETARSAHGFTSQKTCFWSNAAVKNSCSWFNLKIYAKILQGKIVLSRCRCLMRVLVFICQTWHLKYSFQSFFDSSFIYVITLTETKIVSIN